MSFTIICFCDASINFSGIISEFVQSYRKKETEVKWLYFAVLLTLNISSTLTHFMPLISFYIPWNISKPLAFVCFQGVWIETTCIKWVSVKFLFQTWVCMFLKVEINKRQTLVNKCQMSNVKTTCDVKSYYVWQLCPEHSCSVLKKNFISF